MIISVFVRNTLKLVGKVVVAGGAVAYTYHQGLWNPPDENRNKKALAIVSEAAKPLLPFEIPSSEALKLSWNDGVHTLFDTMENSPTLIKDASSSLVEKAKELVK